MAFILTDSLGGRVLNDGGIDAFEGRVGSFGGPNAIFTQNGLVIPFGGSLGRGFKFNRFIGTPTGHKNIAINDLCQIAFLATVNQGGCIVPGRGARHPPGRPRAVCHRYDRPVYARRRPFHCRPESEIAKKPRNCFYPEIPGTSHAGDLLHTSDA